MPTTRRNVLGAVATLAAIGAGATQVIGQDGLPIEITQVKSEEEYVTLENTSMDDVDISGYVVAFEYGNEGTDQRRTLPDGSVIGGGQSFFVATGAKQVPEADVTFDYEGEVLNNDDEDVVALLTPDESTVIAKSSGSSSADTTTTADGSESSGGDESDDGNDGTTTTDTEDGSEETTDESSKGNENSDSETNGDETTDDESDDGESSNDATTDEQSDDDSEPDC